MNFLSQYGSLAVFGVMFLEQAGLPIPAVPILLGAGALVGTGQLNGVVVVALALVGSLMGDFIWYELGRRHGAKVLSTLCKISMEPQTCIRRTENTFVRYGVKTLLAAKFLPGFNLLAPPLAGIFNVSRKRFFAYDLGGAAIYCGLYLALGFIFREQIEKVLLQIASLGKGALWLVGGLFGLYLVFKFLERRWFVYQLRAARITPEDLRTRLQQGESLTIIDLRSAIEASSLPYRIPGAIHLPAESLVERFHEIPRDREIILYCSCPNEIGSGHSAMRLRRKGVKNIRLLLGGIHAWRYQQFDCEPLSAPAGTQGI